jgi:hypothetical protein
MKITSKTYKKISHRLGKWILGLLGFLGVSLLVVCQAWLNAKLATTLPLPSLLLASEVIILLLLLLCAYILLFYLQLKSEMKDLKTFLNKYVYAKNEIHNPFFKEPSHTVEDHLSIKPFYEAVEKAAKKNQT